MKHLKSLLSQNLTWEFSNNKIILKNNDETIVELQEKKSTGSTFVLSGKNYTIRNEGFWTTKTIIEIEGKALLMLKRNFFGNKGSVEFDNGNLYSCKINNAPLVSLSFCNKEGKEILFYKLDATRNPKIVLNIVDQTIDENELIYLIIVGWYSFKDFANENDGSDILLLVA